MASNSPASNYEVSIDSVLKRFQCEYCPEFFYHIPSLKSHHAEEHQGSKLVLPSEFSTATTKGGIVTQEGFVKCDFCKNIFMSSFMETHIEKTHPRFLKYGPEPKVPEPIEPAVSAEVSKTQKDSSPQSFSSGRQRTVEKICNLCPFRAIDRNRLAIHQQVHEPGVDVNICSVCGWWVLQKYEYLHRRRHNLPLTSPAMKVETE
ncbi:unnamed protein product [Orchesella dallaii]|uniref:C2H2-type domain-containing protein n=1 Tax=Orchesella dallaii TaxID=48710 RepID=A0ABP1RS12_9HEXA